MKKIIIKFKKIMLKKENHFLSCECYTYQLEIYQQTQSYFQVEGSGEQKNRSVDNNRVDLCLVLIRKSIKVIMSNLEKLYLEPN